MVLKFYSIQPTGRLWISEWDDEDKLPEGKKEEVSKTHLKEDCDIMIDQIRSIDNRRLVRKLGHVGVNVRHRIRENLKIVLDLD